MSILSSARLRLVPMNDSHFDGLFAMNSDPAVMRYITGKPDTPADTQAMIERVKARWLDCGYSWWSFFELDSEQIIGAGCIQHLGRDAANPLEIGWRLRQDKWGQGYASEAAECMASFAFDTLKTDLLCAVCQPENLGSAHVMKKLGMHYKGLERWYEMEVAVYQMTGSDWASRAQAECVGPISAA
ncbi:GNAT family N-acetyltransferase [Undibacterium parvum]|uniref:N-acetyltransferase n=1 Tax=Undibacterium parvum TaxID=401471 RepID=A0A3S9HJP2_9BURK|nr:GNAT family N-acetyltransferase [Undibacterium parvum]AZP12318.1 N-acetyltransferase [Undibacterium parvum]